MLVVPAIDILGGRCVRLWQGDYERETVFATSPVAVARRWVREGAEMLHLVDLDAARGGKSGNHPAIEAVVREVATLCGEGNRPPSSVGIQLGGGIRDLAAMESWLSAGVTRVVVGTAAVSDPQLVHEATRRFPGRVWVGIDARAGKVAVEGWTRSTEISAVDLARAAEALGAAGIVYTDIERDGTGAGVNTTSTASLADAINIPVMASGGVHSVADVERLRRIEERGIVGVIVGRALYDESVRLPDLLRAAK